MDDDSYQSEWAAPRGMKSVIINAESARVPLLTLTVPFAALSATKLLQAEEP